MEENNKVGLFRNIRFGFSKRKKAEIWELRGSRLVMRQRKSCSAQMEGEVQRPQGGRHMTVSRN